MSEEIKEIEVIEVEKSKETILEVNEDGDMCFKATCPFCNNINKHGVGVEPFKHSSEKVLKLCLNDLGSRYCDKCSKTYDI